MLSSLAHHYLAALDLASAAGLKVAEAPGTGARQR